MLTRVAIASPFFFTNVLKKFWLSCKNVRYCVVAMTRSILKLLQALVHTTADRADGHMHWLSLIHRYMCVRLHHDMLVSEKGHRFSEMQSLIPHGADSPRIVVCSASST